MFWSSEVLNIVDGVQDCLITLIEGFLLEKPLYQPEEDQRAHQEPDDTTYNVTKIFFTNQNQLR